MLSTFSRNDATTKTNEANIVKENITEEKSVMVSLKKEVAAMLESGNNLRRTNFWAFKFNLFQNFLKRCFTYPISPLVT